MSMSADVSSPEKAPAARTANEAAAPAEAPDAAAILRKMQEAQAREGSPSLKERVRRLERLEQAVISHQDAVALAMKEDFGNKARAEVLTSEIYLVVSGIRHARAHVREWMEPQSREVPLPIVPAQGEVIPQPVGVVGIVSPWNYPLNLALLPLVGALAAGNRAILKPSEIVPKTSNVLADIIRTAFEPDVVTVVLGDAQVGEAFTKLPFDHLVFTGSTRVGRMVMKAASDNLVPVTLELGGKSPVIVGPDADINEAGERVMMGKVWNAGQTCVAPDYAIVSKDKLEAFVAACKKSVGAMLPRMIDNPDYTSIVSDRHYGRLRGLISEAKDKGARIEEINPAGEAFPAEARKIPPTLVVDADPALTVMQEEIFGPILPIVVRETLDDAIAFVNERPRPLALYYFGRKTANIDRVLDRTRSGGVTINDTMLHATADELPFGGIGASGTGAYHGRDGFEAFTKWRPVVYQSRINGRRFMAPPYGKIINVMMRILIGR